MASGCSDCSSRARMPPMNIDESPCTRRTGRSSANQRSPGVSWITRRRAGPSGPATRSKIAAPSRPRIRSAAPNLASPFGVGQRIQCASRPEFGGRPGFGCPEPNRVSRPPVAARPRPVGGPWIVYSPGAWLRMFTPSERGAYVHACASKARGCRGRRTLGRLVRWVGWCAGSAGALGRLVRWVGWSAGSAGALGRLERRVGWSAGLVRMERWVRRRAGRVGGG